MNLTRLLFLSAVVLAVLTGCRKDRLFTEDPGARLIFSVDSVLFDTIFTQSPASVIKRFVARNPQNRAVRVNIALEGGQPSPYRINVDGLSGITFENVEILSGDSVFVFVEVTLDQNNTNNPFLVEDHVLFNTNGNLQQVLLQAYGQDAYYHKPGPPEQQIQGFPNFGIVAGGLDEGGNPICETVYWASDKPHVVIGYAVVDDCATLIIEPGARIHVHGGGGMWIYRNGRIIANGTHDQPITFQGDRLEPIYAELPGQWDRIWINEGSADNEFTHVTIKNALIGLQPETWPLMPELGTSANRLILNNVKIRNCSAAGILSRNYRITSNNLFVGDCGQHSVALTGGGEYFFNHSTIANYWNIQNNIRTTPAFVVTNSFQAFNGSIHVREIENSEFLNGIIYGSNENEFLLALESPEMQTLTFERFIIKTTEPTNDTQFFPIQDRIYRNMNPGFLSVQDRNFDLEQNANARGKAIPVAGNTVAIFDIKQRLRGCLNTGFTDLGAYEPCP